MLRACRDHGVRRMVLASTSDCYGRNPEVPFSEESVSVIGGPHVRRWSYAVSKMFEEQALLAFRERHKLEGVILRLFGGYGPRQNITWWGGPQSVFIGAALKGEELELHGTGQQTRSFTYVDDMVEGFVRAVDVPAADGEMLNIGADREITIEDLARMVWRAGPRRRAADQEGAPRHLRQLRGRAAADPRQPRAPRASSATRPPSRSRKGCRARSPGSARPWRAPACCDPRRGARLQRGGQHGRAARADPRAARAPRPCAIASWSWTTAPRTAPRRPARARRPRGLPVEVVAPRTQPRAGRRLPDGLPPRAA